MAVCAHCSFGAGCKGGGGGRSVAVPTPAPPKLKARPPPYAVWAFQAYGYTLLQLIGNDALFIRTDDRDLFGSLFFPAFAWYYNDRICWSALEGGRKGMPQPQWIGARGGAWDAPRRSGGPGHRVVPLWTSEWHTEDHCSLSRPVARALLPAPAFRGAKAGSRVQNHHGSRMRAGSRGRGRAARMFWKVALPECLFFFTERISLQLISLIRGRFCLLMALQVVFVIFTSQPVVWYRDG